MGFSLDAANDDDSLVAVWKLLIAAASRCSSRALEPGSIVAAHGLRCSVACGIFPDQGSNPSLLHWQADFLPLSLQGSPLDFFFS